MKSSLSNRRLPSPQSLTNTVADQPHEVAFNEGALPRARGASGPDGMDPKAVSHVPKNLHCLLVGPGLLGHQTASLNIRHSCLSLGAHQTNVAAVLERLHLT